LALIALGVPPTYVLTASTVFLVLVGLERCETCQVGGRKAANQHVCAHR
jgi:hypothetical protein